MVNKLSNNVLHHCSIALDQRKALTSRKRYSDYRYIASRPFIPLFHYSTSTLLLISEYNKSVQQESINVSKMIAAEALIIESVRRPRPHRTSSLTSSLASSCRHIP